MTSSTSAPDRVRVDAGRSPLPCTATCLDADAARVAAATPTHRRRSVDAPSARLFAVDRRRRRRPASIAATNNEVDTDAGATRTSASALSDISPGARRRELPPRRVRLPRRRRSERPGLRGIGDDSTTTGHRRDTIMVAAPRPRHRHGVAPVAPSRPAGHRSARQRPRRPDQLLLHLRTEGARRHDQQELRHRRSTTTSRSTSTGFKELVDAVGGVPACFDYPTRDTNTGLRVQTPGCYTLNGVQASPYVRIRHFEQYIDGEWQEDPRSDLGRIDRQQQFILDAVSKAQGDLGEDLLHLNSVLPAARRRADRRPRSRHPLARQAVPLVDEERHRLVLAAR